MIFPLAIHKVAGQWETVELEVHADLMGPSRVQSNLDQSGSAQTFHHPVAGEGITATVVIHSHALPVGRMPRDSSANLTLVALHAPANNCLINFLDLAGGKLR